MQTLIFILANLIDILNDYTGFPEEKIKNLYLHVTCLEEQKGWIPMQSKRNEISNIYFIHMHCHNSGTHLAFGPVSIILFFDMYGNISMSCSLIYNLSVKEANCTSNKILLKLLYQIHRQPTIKNGKYNKGGNSETILLCICYHMRRVT